METDPNFPSTNGRGGLSTPVIIALIGAAATILATILTGFFGLLGNSDPSASGAPANSPSVSVEGPAAAPLNEPTYFTIISANADRADWSIGGFNNNETTALYPLSPSHQIVVTPTNPTRVGQTFTLVVTAYGTTGATATTSHPFVVTAADQ